MFEISVEREFCAAHAIVINGQREVTHGHNWRVTVFVRGPQLDAEGMLCDFHALERHVDEVTGRLDNADLNRTTPFDSVNPTAEQVARHIAESVSQRLPADVWLSHVRITEAPGCAATFWMDQRQ
jgi:6-pyruvoyltetrahydropterin/6-carboxytetrahydropterin synthase